jgi:hypothetical protein
MVSSTRCQKEACKSTGRIVTRTVESRAATNDTTDKIAKTAPSFEDGFHFGEFDGLAVPGAIVSLCRHADGRSVVENGTTFILLTLI